MAHEEPAPFSSSPWALEDESPYAPTARHAETDAHPMAVTSVPALGPASGKRVAQASSQVKARIGASQMVSRSKATSITVRAARRRSRCGGSQ